MTAMRRALSPALVRVLLLTTLLTGLTGLEAVAAAPHADAAVRSSTLVLGTKAVQIARTKQGTPYRYGAAGPTRFDCSGYTRWVFARLGKRLPHSSSGQLRATVRVPASRRQVGDLVFFGSRGRIWHVGIYAGGNRIWHSPRSGDHVRLARLWTSRVTYGRVR